MPALAMADTHAAISNVIRLSRIAADGRTLTMCNSQGRVGVTRYKTPHERHRSFLQKPTARSFTTHSKIQNRLISQCFLLGGYLLYAILLQLKH